MHSKIFRKRRIFITLFFLVISFFTTIANPLNYQYFFYIKNFSQITLAHSLLEKIPVQNTSSPTQGPIPNQLPTTHSTQNHPNQPLASHPPPPPKYDRTKFYKTWPSINGCSLRQHIIKRELSDTIAKKNCDIIAGNFIEPYNGTYKNFTSKSEISKNIQIDHVVALSDAWKKGASTMTPEQRYKIATDPLNLIAADAKANIQKGDSDASAWLPKNQGFRCEYITRQIKVKHKYQLFVTPSEKSAMQKVLKTCLPPP